ncbi:MAG: Ni/Fe hydrogenase subunit alpha [Verrucomicrobia bacterium]|nr:Ni/Fe hydrogenase subunit alpha [Verrucomicrobiota bacterium]MBV8482369.1 Ni/Fe hydrogenase subunit alpha [Verrucomicrobiota bacterium]
MPKQIVIDPVTRIEGHSKITIHLDDTGEVQDAHFHVTQFRGFEKFCEGRPFAEMPSITARICGICPVSHLMASAKACDALLAVQIPPTAAKLRRIMNLAQLIQSHALSFFHLSSPDLLFGMDGDPAKRNILGIIESHPQLAKDGIALRKFGQEIIAMLGGKRIHPAWAVPGGVSEPLSEEKRERILTMLPESVTLIERTLSWYKGILETFREEIRVFGNFPSMFMGLVTPESETPGATSGKPGGYVGQGGNGRAAALEHYDGVLRLVDASGQIVLDGVDPATYQQYLAEAVEPFSYLKSPYFKPAGYPEGIYRVGPLARLNIIDRCGTPKADAEWTEFRALRRGVILSSFHQHYARLVEILYGIERIEQILSEPGIRDKHVRAFAEPNRSEGIGVAEAPRGTLIHHYTIDENGLIRSVNLIIATGHNNLAMNRSVKQVAQHYVKGSHLQEGMLNRVEAVIRCFDPCLSCSTHAIGRMPLHIQLLGPESEVLDEIKRN